MERYFKIKNPRYKMPVTVCVPEQSNRFIHFKSLCDSMEIAHIAVLYKLSTSNKGCLMSVVNSNKQIHCTRRGREKGESGAAKSIPFLRF